MSEDPNTDSSWEPSPIPAEDFYKGNALININRAPYNQVSGVTFKRAAHVKRVGHTPGHTVHWLFSEQTTTAEGLLDSATFAFLHDVHLPPGTQTEECAHPGETHLLYVNAGTGWLYHRPTDGSPILTRPLRPGDAALIRGTERYSLANTQEETLTLMIVGLNEK